MLDKVVAAVEAQARRLVDEFHRSVGPRGHKGHCEVDREIEEALRESLQAILPAAFAGEETGMSAGAKPGYTWLVDPHDGTYDFMQGRRGSAVSVALLRGAAPVLGVVCSPMPPDRGRDTIAWAAGAALVRNGRPVNNDLSRQSLYAGGFVWATASAALRMSGSDTISSSGVPARLRSMPVWPWKSSCSDLPASSSRCARVMPMVRVVPSSNRISKLPLPTIGASNWLIW